MGLHGDSPRITRSAKAFLLTLLFKQQTETFLVLSKSGGRQLARFALCLILVLSFAYR
jgi:hypothetical protein